MKIFTSQFESVCDRVIGLVKKQMAFNVCVTFMNADENCGDYIDKLNIWFILRKIDYCKSVKMY